MKEIVLTVDAKEAIAEAAAMFLEQLPCLTRGDETVEHCRERMLNDGGEGSAYDMYLAGNGYTYKDERGYHMMGSTYDIYAEVIERYGLNAEEDDISDVVNAVDSVFYDALAELERSTGNG